MNNASPCVRVEEFIGLASFIGDSNLWRAVGGSFTEGRGRHHCCGNLAEMVNPSYDVDEVLLVTCSLPLMSRAAKATLIASIVVSSLTVWGVHYLQQQEHDVRMSFPGHSIDFANARFLDNVPGRSSG